MLTYDLERRGDLPRYDYLYRWGRSCPPSGPWPPTWGRRW